MGRPTNTASKEKVVRREARQPNPVDQCGSGRLCDLELHGSRCLLLHDNRPCRDSLAVTDVSNLQLKQVARAQLAIDAKIEQRQFAGSTENLKPDPDSPNFFEFERRLLTNTLAFVPRSGNNSNSNFIHHGLLKIGRSLILTLSGTPAYDVKRSLKVATIERVSQLRSLRLQAHLSPIDALRGAHALRSSRSDRGT